MATCRDVSPSLRTGIFKVRSSHVVFSRPQDGQIGRGSPPQSMCAQEAVRFYPLLSRRGRRRRGESEGGGAPSAARDSFRRRADFISFWIEMRL